MADDLPPSIEITPERAVELQRAAYARGFLPLWVVMTGTEEYGPRFVARPWLVGGDGQRVCLNHLLADDLEALRAKLPPRLHRLPHQPGEDLVILETWL